MLNEKEELEANNELELNEKEQSEESDQGTNENAHNLIANENDAPDLSSDGENDAIHGQTDGNDNAIAAPQWSNRLANLPLDTIFGDVNLVTIENNNVDDQDEIFQWPTVFKDKDEDHSNIIMSSFKQQHTSGAQLFQTNLNWIDHEETIDAKILTPSTTSILHH